MKLLVRIFVGILTVMMLPSLVLGSVDNPSVDFTIKIDKTYPPPLPPWMDGIFRREDPKTIDFWRFAPKPWIKHKIHKDFAMDATVIVQHPSGGYGSGFFVNSKGWLITNAHVAKPFIKSKINPQIKLNDGRILNAIIYSIDENNDLALLKVDRRPTEYFSFLKIDADGYDVGDPVRILGSGGREFFKSKKSHVIGIDLMSKWELVCAPGIRPGDSGGPILDIQNEVIGVASAYNSRYCYSLGVPLYDLSKFLKQHGLN